jgi:predicted nucleic acid-binding protein
VGSGYHLEAAAEAEGIETRGTAYLVLSAVKRGRLSPEAGRETIDAMIDHGWYVAPDLYARIVRTLASFE